MIKLFLVLPVFLLLSAPRRAGAAPGSGAARDDGQAGYYCGDIKKPFFAETAKGEFAAQRKLAMPEKFTMPKPAGVKRVFVLGESVAALLDRGVCALSSCADLPWEKGADAVDNSGFEIINCGMGGYESVRIYGIFKEVLRYDPDLLVILSGNHEGSPDQNCPGLDFELKRRKFRLFEKYYSRTDVPQQAVKKASLKIHAAMVSDMSAAARKAGVPVVFCTLPANVRDMPSRTQLLLEDPQFAAGYKLFYENDHKAALEKFRAGLAAQPYDSLLNFYTARTLDKLGRAAEAAAYYRKAVDVDADMARASEARNDSIRGAAAAEGACVADLDKLFRGVADSGLPGFREFTDGMHWRTSYNRAVWNEIFRSASACGLKGFEKFRAADSPTWKETAREDALKRLSYAATWLNPGDRSFNEASLAELAYVRQEAPGLLENAAVSAQALDKAILRNFWSIGKVVQLEALFPLFLGHLSEVERRQGNYGAAMILCDRALALDPARGFLKLLRAQILAGQGNKKEAEREFNGSGLVREARGLGLAYGFETQAAGPRPAGGGPGPLAGKKTPPPVGQARPPGNTSLTPGPGKHSVLKAVPFDGAPRPAPKEGVEALMEQCLDASGEGGKERALQACQGAAYAAGPGKPGGGNPYLGSEASFESYRLLTALGRNEEAGEALLWTVENASPSWPKLAEARKLLGQKAP
ncbi:MAG: hypothetical protein A2016_08990 [Elusimicrobia bacterium GWF2_62_30]|nr:MAG: hypothetical protein A2016_08990 [Elusimicrobia bacterium GWF2_62_30]